ncbi:YbaK/EbsC family protein [Geothrix sp. 21YS21S-2]|uniref:YbaK/EbsC family protein n=1 Tax=Geothrix sp. 21YS21S-2 TaxID=3068893 RepID=UPI0027B9AB34|nr:YbaK/EbsC family protein [Geothrix sp. 21YS21S-2]
MVPEKVQKVFRDHGLEAIEFEPGSTHTVELAAARHGVEPARIAKSLLFRNKAEAYTLVVCPGDKRIPSGTLKRVLGSKVSMADAGETERVTGYRPGGVCPFALEGVEILLDRELGRYETIFPAAGTDATSVRTTLEALARITGGRVVDFVDAAGAPL